MSKDDAAKTQAHSVLVAAEDEGLRSLAKLTLEGEAFTVSVAEDFEQAVMAIGRGAPDILLLDSELEGADPLKLVETLRAQPETESVKVVLVFDRANQVIDQKKATDAGVDEFLGKPVNSMALLQKVTKLLK